MTQKTRLFCAVTVAVAALFAVPASADIIFDVGNHPQTGEENILFNGAGTDAGPGLTVSGRTNQSDFLVDFTGTENLVTPSKGQARIEAVDGQFTSLNIALEAGGDFGDFILNPFVAGHGNSGSGTITVTVHQVSGPDAVFPFAVSSNGQNFLTIIAINGQRISSIDLLSDIGITQLKQPRISDACVDGDCPPVQSVPEPGSLALLGLGALALAATRRRKT